EGSTIPDTAGLHPPDEPRPSANPTDPDVPGADELLSDADASSLTGWPAAALVEDEDERGSPTFRSRFTRSGFIAIAIALRVLLGSAVPVLVSMTRGAGVAAPARPPPRPAPPADRAPVIAAAPRPPEPAPAAHVVELEIAGESARAGAPPATVTVELAVEPAG